MLKPLYGWVLGLAGLTIVGCQQPMTKPSESDIGRYQFSEDARWLYVIDTATGTVWSKPLTGNNPLWMEWGSPVNTKP